MSRMNGGVGVNTGESVGDGYASQMLDDGMSLPSYFVPVLKCKGLEGDA